MVGADDFLNVSVGQFAMYAVNECAHFPRINEQRLAFAGAQFVRQLLVAMFRQCASGLVLRDEPEADGNLRGVEELTGHRNHAVHEIGFNDSFADVAFAGLVRGHASIGENETREAIGREVMDEMLNPGEIGVAPSAAFRTSSARHRRRGASRSR